MQDLIGSSISGRPMRGGVDGLPTMGGACGGEQCADGTRHGWDGRRMTGGAPMVAPVAPPSTCSADCWPGCIH